MLLNRLKTSILLNKLKKLTKISVRREGAGYYQPFRSGDKKYEDLREDKWNQLTEWDKISGGFSVVKREMKLYFEELREKYSLDASFNNFEDQEIVKLWDFNQKNNTIVSSLYNKRNQLNDMNKWVTACDSDYNEGYSTVEWTVSPSGRALFSGYLDTRLPLDGRIARAGYAFIGCERARKSFYRQNFFDWRDFTHLLVRVRGDGRNWLINLNVSDDKCDITWFDRYTYALYTHGGPYWQWAKIPFSRFYLQHKGYAQDYQPIIPLANVSQIGFLLVDQNSGPFSLEIDYVGAMYDSQWVEKTAYESYYHKENPWKSPGG